MCRCGIFRGRVLETHCFEDRLTGNRFNVLLNKEYIELLEDILLNQRRTMWFHLDGCSSFSRLVHQTLEEIFAGHCVERGMDIEWPPKSPDLTVMDYFWGRLKEIVYERTLKKERMNLKNTITSVITQGGSFLREERDFRPHLVGCINEEGFQYEHI